MLKTEAKSEHTIHHVDKFICNIAKSTNLFKPSEVVFYIANKKVTHSMKKDYCHTYQKPCEYYEIGANILSYGPKYRRIKIPTEGKMNMLIVHSRPILSVNLSLSKANTQSHKLNRGKTLISLLVNISNRCSLAYEFITY
jgi:hypothetical protein